MCSRGVAKSNAAVGAVVVSQPAWLQIDKISLILFPMLLLKTKLWQASFVMQAQFPQSGLWQIEKKTVKSR